MHSISRLWKSHFIRRLLGVAFVSSFLTAGDAFRPLDELVYSAQAMQQRSLPSGQVVLIEVRDADKQVFERTAGRYSRWAAVVDRLSEMKARRVFYDYLVSTPGDIADEKLLEAALKRTQNQSIFATRLEPDPKTYPRKYTDVEPIRPFIVQTVPVAMINHMRYELNDVRDYPYSATFRGVTYKTPAAALVGANADDNRSIKLDKRIDVKKFPSYSYGELMSGKVPVSAIKGKYVVFSVDAFNSDFHTYFWYGDVRGGRLIAAAAETLLRGVPTVIPPLVAVVIGLLLVSFLQVSRPRSIGWTSYIAVVVAALAAGFLAIACGLILPIGSIILVTSAFLWVVASSAARDRFLKEGSLLNLNTNLPNRLAAELRAPDPDVAVFCVVVVPGGRSVFDRSALQELAALLKNQPSSELFDANGGTFFLLVTHTGSLDLVEYTRTLHTRLRGFGFNSDTPFAGSYVGIDLEGRSLLADRLAAAEAAALDARQEGPWLRLAQDPRADEDGHNGVFAPSSAEDIDQLEIVYSVHRNAEDKPITGATIQLLRDGFVENDVSFCGLIAKEPASYLFEKLLSSAVSVISSIDGGQTITVCVPLPVRALANASFVEILRRRIRASRVSPESMCLVVDVPSLIVQGSRGLGLLSDARSIGLGIGLARFDQHDRGLDFVRSLPATHLMMDGQFADYLIRENFQLLQSSKGLADELGRMLVVTNVSTSASQAVLQDLGVTVEGPVNGSPVSAARFIEIASIASVSQVDQR